MINLTLVILGVNMRYRVLGLFCLGLINGCGSDDKIVNEEMTGSGNSSTQVNVDSDESDEISNEILDDISSEIPDEILDVSVNNSETLCLDELTDVLTLINKQRAQQQICGDERFGPVAPVTWNTLLTSAAKNHSNNMANYDFFSHIGLDESSSSTRVTAQGYIWSSVSENIAAGQKTAQLAVDGWMKSEGHCRNIMNSTVTEMGLACSQNNDATYTYYWTQVFAKSR